MKDVAIGAGVAGGIAGTVSLGSAAVISAAGFTTSGVVAGSIAAGVQSGIGLVAAGSTFASVQSLGALGLGIFGTAALPIVVSTAVIGGAGYAVYNLIK